MRASNRSSGYQPEQAPEYGVDDSSESSDDTAPDMMEATVPLSGTGGSMATDVAVAAGGGALVMGGLYAAGRLANRCTNNDEHIVDEDDVEGAIFLLGQQPGGSGATAAARADSLQQIQQNMATSAAASAAMTISSGVASAAAAASGVVVVPAGVGLAVQVAVVATGVAAGAAVAAAAVAAGNQEEADVTLPVVVVVPDEETVVYWERGVVRDLQDGAINGTFLNANGDIPPDRIFLFEKSLAEAYKDSCNCPTEDQLSQYDFECTVPCDENGDCCGRDGDLLHCNFDCAFLDSNVAGSPTIVSIGGKLAYEIV